MEIKQWLSGHDWHKPVLRLDESDILMIWRIKKAKYMRRERTRLFRSIDDLPRRDLLEEVTDAFTPPEDLLLNYPASGMAGYIQDRERIAGYFRKAVGDIKVAGTLSDGAKK